VFIPDKIFFSTFAANGSKSREKYFMGGDAVLVLHREFSTKSPDNSRFHVPQVGK
jgi:hypothetical protein